MRERFFQLWAHIGARFDCAAAWLYLADCYAQPHRRYHTLQHIRFCLDRYDCVRDASDLPTALECAIWYHDLIYDPQAKDNEFRSAQVARQVCLEAGKSDAFAREVETLILATRHDTAPSTVNQQLITDIDLAIFAAPAAEFDRYEMNIRHEYAFVPAAQYAAARIGVLRDFLDRPSIYCSGCFIRKSEAKARENLLRSIRSLQY